MKTSIKFCILFFCLLGLFNGSLLAQKKIDDKGKKKFQKIKEKIRDNEIEKGLKDLDKFLEDYPDYIDAYVTKGNALLSLKEWEAAIDNYYIVLDIDYDYHDHRLWYTIAFAQRQLKQYDEAIDNLEAVLDKMKTNSRMRPNIELEIRQVQFLKEAFRDSVPFNPIKLDSTINTEHLEYLPSFTADGSEFIFTRRIGDNEDLYSGIIVNDSTEITALDVINTPGNEGAHFISPDGNLLIFTACDRPGTNGGCDLYISVKKQGSWTKGQRMNSKFNTRYWESQPSISSDGNSFYFASDRPGGKGKKDIWKVELNQMGKFEAAKNLGAIINTKGNESSPFIHPDGKTLYFRSDTHPGMGDYDIFYSKLDSMGAWSLPKNLGHPINTEKNEGALFVSLDGKTAYYASDQGNEPPQLDIFKFDLPEHARPEITTYFSAIVIDKVTKEPLAAQLEIIKLSNLTKSKHYSNAATGKVLTALPAGHRYALNIQSTGYLFYSKNVDLLDPKDAKDPYTITIELEKIPKPTPESPKESKPIVLENIFYKTGSYELLPESSNEISKLEKLLKENKEMLIKIIGHTDNVGSDVDNQVLSENRAKSVYKALVDSGIEEGRISYEGRGESQAIEDNDTEEGRKKNRRTEFVIIQ